MGKRGKRTMAFLCARKGRGFVVPRFSAGARRFMLVVGGLYLHFANGVRTVEIHRQEGLLDALEGFYRGEQRLIIAFRHVAKEDAAVMMYALGRKLRRAIRIRNRHTPPEQRIIAHAQFLYGRDVLDWAGRLAAWLFPRIGCVPVQNRGSNRDGLNVLRASICKGTFPVALAPEGQVTYHMYTCSPISAGIASMAMWGVQSDKDMVIVPVALGYRRSTQPQAFIRSVLKRWEHQCGQQLSDTDHGPILALLLEAAEKTVGLLEQLYAIQPTRETDPDTLRTRILAVCETAMRRAEHLARQKPEGNLLDRLFNIRYQGVEAVHPEKFDPDTMPPLGKSLADFHALEAHVFLRHSQIVDVLQYVDPAYIAAPCSTGRAEEFALDLLDVVNRVRGGNINSRYSPHGKQALVEIGRALRIGELGILGKDIPRKERLNRINDAVSAALQHTSQQMESHWETSVFSS